MALKTIIVERGVTNSLAKKFNCSMQSVRMALRGVTSTDRSQLIREEALKSGGFYKPNLRKANLV